MVIEHFFSCVSWPFVYVLWRNIYSSPLPLKKIGLFVFSLLCEFFIYSRF